MLKLIQNIVLTQTFSECLFVNAKNAPRHHGSFSHNRINMSCSPVDDLFLLLHFGILQLLLFSGTFRLVVGFDQETLQTP